MSAAGPPPVSSQTLYSVQYLRAAAALAVLLYHISALSQQTWGLDPERIDHAGAAGVDLFFVISGFIMAMIVARPGNFHGREFWVRRIARVAPAYWVITLVVFGLIWLKPQLFNAPISDISTLLTSLSFIALDHGGGNTGPLLVVGWTLNYEMFFYALVALTAGLFGDRRLIGVSVALIALIALGQWLRPVNPTLVFYTDPILFEFVLGILVFKSWNQTRTTGQGLAPLAMLVAGSSLLLIQWERPVGDMRTVFWGVPAAAILYGALGTLSFRNSLLLRLGDWSYALYLTHVFVISLYIKHIISRVTFIELPWQVHYLIMVGAACVVAAMFHVLVERPLSHWMLHRMRRSPATKPAPTASAAGLAE
ncbi:acyltransferase [Hoeflea sp.]|uniref:acyltransferase family protein n=1 Tax=Hoeflea sp. TaxID=1940281 RepID=UPI0025C1F16A|nr:acyltransferase [Hoeflea sp.]